jgi:hypothetical protein
VKKQRHREQDKGEESRIEGNTETYRYGESRKRKQNVMWNRSQTPQSVLELTVSEPPRTQQEEEKKNQK